MASILSFRCPTTHAYEGKSGKNPIVLYVIAPDNPSPYRRKASLPSILRRLSTTLDSVLQDMACAQAGRRDECWQLQLLGPKNGKF